MADQEDQARSNIEDSDESEWEYEYSQDDVEVWNFNLRWPTVSIDQSAVVPGRFRSPNRPRTPEAQEEQPTAGRCSKWH